MRKIKAGFIFILFLWIGNGNLISQSGEGMDSIPSLTGLSVKDLKPVYVVESILRNPFAVSMIRQENLSRLSHPSIEPLLNSTPGIFMQTGALNTNRISIRGVGYREPFATTGLKVYLDEIPLTNGAGETSIEDIHPGVLSGIDVWRGPASALWGAGLGGMIQLKTEIPREDIWMSHMEVGSYDRLRLDQHISFRHGRFDRWGTSVHYQYLHDGGYRDNNDYRKHSLTWMQNLITDNGWLINSFIHGLQLKAFIPSSLNRNDFQNNPSAAAPTWANVNGNEDYTKWITGLNFMFASGKGWIYKGAVFGNFFSSDEVRPFNVLDEKSTAYGTRHRITFQLPPFTTVTTGVELFREDYDFSTFETLAGGQPGQQLTSQGENRSYINAFLQTGWTLGKRWNFFSGLSAAYSHISALDQVASTPVSMFPTMGITYSLPSDMSFSGSVSRGYSVLSFEDVLNADGTINQAIKPETGWSYEFSGKRIFGSHGFVRINLFRMHIKNTILTRRIMDDLFEKINSGSTNHQGIEIETSWNNLSRTFLAEAGITLADYRFDRFIELERDHSGNRLPGAPVWDVHTQFTFFPEGRAGGSLQITSASKVFLDDANQLSGDPYALMHAKAHYRIIDNEIWEWTVSAVLHNIFNEHYASMYQINAPGASPRYFYPGKPRSVYLQLSFRHQIQ